MNDLPLKSKRQVQLILSSIKRVFKEDDIDRLTPIAYKYLYLCSGFIAYHNLYGFRHKYTDVGKLAEEIMYNKQMNEWDNFSPKDSHYSYYKQKADIYKQIIEIVEEFQPNVYLSLRGFEYI